MNIKLTIDIDGQTHEMEGSAAVFATKWNHSDEVSSGITGTMSEEDQAELLAGITSAISRQADDHMKGMTIALGGVMTAAKNFANQTDDPALADGLNSLIKDVGMAIVSASIKQEIRRRQEAKGEMQ